MRGFDRMNKEARKKVRKARSTVRKVIRDDLIAAGFTDREVVSYVRNRKILRVGSYT